MVEHRLLALRVRNGLPDRQVHRVAHLHLTALPTSNRVRSDTDNHGELRL
jgi:hypothetical protein